MLSKSKEEIFELLLGLVLLPIAVICRAFTLYQLWGWFVTPLGVISISLPWAIGLALLYQCCFIPVNIKKEKLELSVLMLASIFTSLHGLIIGYALHLFM